jgi:[ribosomal protein S5]-alanine N-acetyltransferase
MQLVLERCIVRPWRLDDAESPARHANHRKIWLGVRDLFPHPYTIQDAHEFLQRTISEGSAMKFCIEDRGQPTTPGQRSVVRAGDLRVC